LIWISSEGFGATDFCSLEDAKLGAETALRLARYYDDAVALARRVTERSKSLTGSHHFVVCSVGEQAPRSFGAHNFN
jgi:hypothetical protein